MAQPALIWCPFPSEDEARQASHVLVTEQLIACANIIPGMTSIFSWEGKIAEEREAGLLCKTSAALMRPAIARLADLHRYDTPAIVGWMADATSPKTMVWLNQVLDAENEV